MSEHCDGVVGYICVVCNHLLSIFDYETLADRGCNHAWDAVVLKATLDRVVESSLPTGRAPTCGDVAGWLRAHAWKLEPDAAPTLALLSAASAFEREFGRERGPSREALMGLYEAMLPKWRASNRGAVLTRAEHDALARCEAEKGGGDGD